MTETIKSKKIYFAGALFTHKDLIGNALLAKSIEGASEGKYQVHLPQHVETPQDRAEAIRDEDLKAVLESDMALFNFDGTELDSGTVVEFMLAKFLDLPSVILRTDFREGGDQKDGDNWNLMCSFYPRTQVVKVNAMFWYQENLERIQKGDVSGAYEGLALLIVAALDKVQSEPTLLPSDPEKLKTIYEWVSNFAGPSFEKLVKNTVDLDALINRRK